MLAICAVVMLIGVALIMRTIFGGPRSTSPNDFAQMGQAWYYIAETDQYFLDSVHKISPVIDGEGHQGVRVYYFSCGPCTEDSKFVGYYEKFSDEVKKMIQDEEGLSEDLMMQSQVSTDAKKWVVRSEPEGRKILQSARLKCTENKKLHGCDPR